MTCPTILILPPTPKNVTHDSTPNNYYSTTKYPLHPLPVHFFLDSPQHFSFLEICDSTGLLLHTTNSFCKRYVL